LSNNQQAFLALARAGLWEREVKLSRFGNIDYNEVYRLAEEQSVVGLVAAGIEHVVDLKLPQLVVLQFVGQTLQIEQRNSSMNNFIADIVEKMRVKEIYTLLVKGQGIAQCYERPLWRSSGDIDFLLNDLYYEKAKQFLLPLSSEQKQEEKYSKHLGLSINPWYLEIHGSLRTGLSARIDKEVDYVQNDVFYGGNVRSWLNGNTTVFLPAPNNDVFLVFTHFIKHFYKEGMNLRQVCDWCRLIWTYRESLDNVLLETWIKKAGLMKEWKSFASLAVDYLGMSVDAMPLYDAHKVWSEKASKILSFIMCSVHNGILLNTYSIAKVFPCNTILFLPAIFLKVNCLKIKERLFGK